MAEKLVLVVDDEPDMCWALEHLLHSQGFQTRRALNAQEALTLTDQCQFSCAFLDAKLPDMDGLVLARQILANAPQIRIIMVSGYFYRDDVSIQEAIRLGFIHDFISKPFLQQEILKAIE
ncbi:response regulator [Desulfobacca acetoxidans]